MEYTEVFARGTGEGSDIVRKEMYTFLDKGDRSITLRPEFTAGVMRAIISNKLYAGDLPLKLYYQGPAFRYERPQLVTEVYVLPVRPERLRIIFA